MPELTIALGDRSYPIRIDHGVSSSFPAALRERCGACRVGLVTNTTLRGLYGTQLDAWKDELDFVEHVMPDGEQYKTVQTWAGVLDTFLEARVDRGTVLVAFGGGVVGDIAGFAASALLRGVEVVQVPTTLLAMVDSSVGGKTGVNHAMGKNLIGAFYQPRMVWIDTAYLDTLDRRVFVAGYAELYKNAFIGGREMFDFVRDTHEDMFAANRAALAEGIERSVMVKAGVVEQDERESGVRALLNFGHTFAHAFEVHFGYERIMHGEAVLWGMACALDLGRRIGTIPANTWDTYQPLVDALPRPSLPDGDRDVTAIYDAMFSDKKVRDGKLRFVVPCEPGVSRVQEGIDPEPVKESLSDILSRPASV